MLSASPPTDTFTPGHYPGSAIRVGHHRLGPIAIAAIIGVVILIADAVTAAIVLTARTPKSARGVVVALTAADPIAIAQGISITPAPGWTLGNRGPNWVALNNADQSAQLRVVVKPAGGTDVVGVLQADINQLTSTAHFSNLRNLTAPDTKPLQSANFQQEASIDYGADVSTPQGAIPVIGSFTELLNTSNQLSAFINFRQDSSATTQAAGDGGVMINSML
jgi:hypothetical protein